MIPAEIMNYSNRRKVIWLIFVTVLYFVTAKVGLSFAFVQENITPLWPPSGIAFLAFLLLGRWIWVSVFFAALFVNFSTGLPLHISLMIGIGNTVGPFIAVEILRRNKNFQSNLSRIKDVFLFVLLGVAIGPAISSIIGTLSLIYSGSVTAGSEALAAFSWWFGDAIGVLVIAPFYLALYFYKIEKFNLFRVLEGTFLVGIFAAFVYFVFGYQEILTYLIFPFGLWSVLRFPDLGMPTLVLVLASVSIPSAIINGGIPTYRLQLIVLISSITGMVLSSMIKMERVKTTQEIQKSENRAEKYLNISAEIIVSLNRLGEITLLNDSGHRLLGYKPGELLGMNWFELFIKVEDRKSVFNLFRQYMDGAGTSPTTYENSVKAKNGSEVKVFWHNTLLHDDQGKIIGTLSSGENITERKKAEVERERALDLLQNVTNKVPGAVYKYLLRPDGSSCFPFASEGINQIYRVTPAEVQNDASIVFKILHPDDFDAIVASIQKSAKELSPWHHEYRVKFEDGTVYWLLGNALPQRLEDGSVLWYGFITNITDRKELEYDLQKSMVAAEAANRAKDNFLAIVSHELRTPLTAIRGWAQLLKKAKLSDELNMGIRAIDESAVTQSKLIEDLLDISRIVAGKMQFKISSVDIIFILIDSINAARPVSEKKSIEIEMKFKSDPIFVLADVIRMKQVFSNLIYNSIKFTPEGGKITISTQENLSTQGKQLEICFQDSGIGISAEFIDNVFNRFSQEDSTMNRSHGGLGIGLALVKNLLEIQGAQISAKSPGKGLGSTFTVLLPYS